MLYAKGTNFYATSLSRGDLVSIQYSPTGYVSQHVITILKKCRIIITPIGSNVADIDEISDVGKIYTYPFTASKGATFIAIEE